MEIDKGNRKTTRKICFVKSILLERVEGRNKIEFIARGRKLVPHLVKKIRRNLSVAVNNAK
jgi:hypothetical protein